MCTIVIKALTPLSRISCIKMYKNNARSRLFCRIAKRCITFTSTSPGKFSYVISGKGLQNSPISLLMHNSLLLFPTTTMNIKKPWCLSRIYTRRKNGNCTFLTGISTDLGCSRKKATSFSLSLSAMRNNLL